MALLALLAASAVALALPGPGTGTRAPQDALSADASLGRVVDREGVARRRPVLAYRWGPADERMRIEPGDWFETGARGANALALKLGSGAELILGPGGLLEVHEADRVTLTRGELEVVCPEGVSLAVGGPRASSVAVRERAVLRAREGQLTRLDDDPRWLTGYKGNASTEALGSLLADIDGRNVPLTMGYHQVTVDVRDQIARTVIEESFVNHTPGVLEGVFYFPLPADASISGFGMWIGDELVQGEIVEQERAREIYETILREKRDPGLLEWAGGSIFKARVYPIGSEKRIRIAYTQVLPKRGDTYAYHYALQSDLLRQFPLKRLRIQVDIHSSETLAEVESPSHDCRVQQSEHSARVEFEAAEFSPERDFELRVRAAAPAGGVTAIPHRRGDDGYFMLLLSPPELAARAQPDEQPLELILLADTSGSMWGTPRDNQVAFVEALLGSLGSRDTFELATVDVETRFASERPQRSTADTREAALGFLEAREPLGWTDLDRAFASACERAGPRTAIVYVGDGAATAGDPDPAAFARRLARLYRGQGSVHAVVPGSSSEMLALDAMAALGGGSVRTIGGGTDPASTAFELLDELTLPAVKDLRLAFEGIEVAAVYPARLPNLPAGRQQIVLGRFDPRAGDLAGRVRVRGTLDGAPVEFTGELALAADDEGNSFIPRLWARRHLDQLLGQGASKEIRERVIALSEDFQIITPFTSFLVLESDADRERFGVTKRLRMRDGEEFFTAGREASSHELTRQQMQKAKAWRLQLQARFLAGLADLERARTDLLREPSLYLDHLGALSSLGYVQAAGGGSLNASFDRSYSVGGAKESEAFDFNLFADEPFADADAGGEYGAEGEDSWGPGDSLPAEPASAPAEERLDSGRAMRKSVASSRQERFSGGASDEFFMGLGERQQVRRAKGLYAGPGPSGPASSPMSRAYYPLQSLLNLFPSLPPAPGAGATPNWPADVQQLLAALDRRTSIRSAAGGFQFTTETRAVDHHGRVSTHSAQHLLSAGSWAQQVAHVLSWNDAQLRGVLSLGWDLGRTRASAESDAADWSEPLTWWFGRSLASYVGHSGQLEELPDGRVRVLLTQLNSPTYALELILERERGLLLEAAWLRSGEASSRTVYGDFREVGGSWWPGSAVASDAEGRELTRTTLEVEALTPQRFASRMQTRLAPLDGALLLRETQPDVQAAKQAAREGQVTLEQRFELLMYYAASQRWDEAAPQLAAFEALAGELRGLEAVRLAYLQLSRRNEELRVALLAAATRLANGTRTGELVMAGQMLGFAQGLEAGREQLDLLAALRPIYERHPESPDVALIWDQRLTSALDAMQRFEQAFAQRASMSARYPYQPNVQADYARALAQRGELDSALELLATVDGDNGPWQPYERGVLRSTWLDLLWNGYRLEQLVEICEAWLRGDPEALDTSTAHRFLSALVFLDREQAARERITQWLAPAARSELSPGERARMQAAVQHLLGQGYGLHSYRRFDEDRALELAAAARLLAHGDDQLNLASQIATQHYFRDTDAGRAFLAELMAELEAGVESLPAARLQSWVQWLRSASVAPEVGVRGAQAWDAIFERVYRRWLASEELIERNALQWVVLQNAPRELQLRLYRRVLATAEPGAPRVDAAHALLQALLAGPWDSEVEDEACGLLATLELDAEVSDALREANLDLRVLALYDLTSWLPGARATAAVEALPGVNSMPRRILRSEAQRALREARLATLARLASLEPSLGTSDLAPWLAIERSWLQVKTRSDDAAARSSALELLAGLVELQELRQVQEEQAATSAQREHILLARSAATLTWLLTRADEAVRSEQEAQLIALLERGQASGSEAVDWRELIFVERVLLERTERLETELEAWYGAGDDLRHVRWGVARAHIAAERGQLELAVRTLEQVEALDELSHEDLRTLSDLFTALDAPRKAREARIRSWQMHDEYQLANQLQNQVQLYQRRGEEPPPELDGEIPVRLIALLRKSQNPANQLWLLQQFYAPTKDYRLLECLPEGVLGHSSQAIYPFLRQADGLFDLIQEEATIDRLQAHLMALREASDSATDRRALALLEFGMLRRAAAQSHGIERHLEGALAALRSAEREQWLEGEPLLMAEFLAGQGPLQPAALADEQVRVLRALQQAARDPQARFGVAAHLAHILWDLGQRDEAVRVLSAALDALREASGGRLPEQANRELEKLSSWLTIQGGWIAAEALWNAELSADHPTRQLLWLDEQRHDLYRDAVLAPAELSLGSGLPLYRAVLASFRRALAVRTNENHAARLLGTLCDLWTRAVRRLPEAPTAADSLDFAFSKLPGVLALYQYRGGQNMVGSMAECLQRVHGFRTELEFLVARAENEPSWLRQANQDFWAQHGYRLAEARSNAGTLDRVLEQRVLAIVLTALRDDLVSRNTSNRAVYYVNHNYYWHEKRADFLRAALAVLAERRDSGPSVVHISQYLFFGIEAHDEAIAALLEAHRRGILDIDGRRQLCDYLQRRERWRESVAPLLELVADQPEAMDNRVMLMLAYFHLGRQRELLGTLDGAEAWLRENERWNEGPIAELAAGCLATELFERSVTLFDEAIALHVKSTPNRGVGDGVLSRYYRDQAGALSGLGRTDAAVDAAAGAIVSWGQDIGSRSAELQRLNEILAAAADLDAYIARLDAEVADTGLENPIVRKALGQVLAEQKRYAPAIQQLRLALAAQPNDAETGAQLVRTLDDAGQREQAAQATLERARLASHDVNLWCDVGDRMRSLERLTDAERAFTNLAEMLPNESASHHRLAEARQSQLRWDEAARSWDQVVRIRPGEPTGYLGLARCLIEGGERQEAEQVLRKLESTDWPERFNNVPRETEQLRKRLRRTN